MAALKVVVTLSLLRARIQAGGDGDRALVLRGATLGLTVVDVAALEVVVTLSLLRENCIYSSGLGRR